MKKYENQRYKVRVILRCVEVQEAGGDLDDPEVRMAIGAEIGFTSERIRQIWKTFGRDAMRSAIEALREIQKTESDDNT